MDLDRKSLSCKDFLGDRVRLSGDLGGGFPGPGREADIRGGIWEIGRLGDLDSKEFRSSGGGVISERVVR